MNRISRTCLVKREREAFNHCQAINRSLKFDPRLLVWYLGCCFLNTFAECLTRVIDGVRFCEGVTRIGQTLIFNDDVHYSIVEMTVIVRNVLVAVKKHRVCYGVYETKPEI